MIPEADTPVGVKERLLRAHKHGVGTHLSAYQVELLLTMIHVDGR